MNHFDGRSVYELTFVWLGKRKAQNPKDPRKLSFWSRPMSRLHWPWKLCSVDRTKSISWMRAHLYLASKRRRCH